jgi:hypothetical protein
MSEVEEFKTPKYIRDYCRKYRENNKDIISKANKKYYEANKKLVTCTCGAKVYEVNLKVHLKSKKHLRDLPLTDVDEMLSDLTLTSEVTPIVYEHHTHVC